MAWVSVWTWPVLAKSYEQKLCRALPYTENCLMEQIKQSARSVVHLCICLDEPKRRSCFFTLPSAPLFFPSRYLVCSEKPWILASPVNKFHSLIRLVVCRANSAVQTVS